jgi:hypothetical protein
MKGKRPGQSRKCFALAQWLWPPQLRCSLAHGTQRHGPRAPQVDHGEKLCDTYITTKHHQASFCAKVMYNADTRLFFLEYVGELCIFVLIGEMVSSIQASSLTPNRAVRG